MIHHYSNENELKIHKLGALLLMTSQGIPFMHQGQEWGNTKIIAGSESPDVNIGKIDRNSYNKDNETKWMDWNEVKDNSIVEMRYNKDGLNGVKWDALRVRKDKKKPNHITTSNNVWYTIKNEVSEDLIRNNKSPVMMHINKYYIGLETNTSQILRKFNNYIKFKLINGVISSFKDEKISLLFNDI